MTVAARHRIMSFEDFLAWEARQEVKYEFDGFEPVAMAGGSSDHARLQRNLTVAMDSRLRGSPCEFFGSDMKLVAANRARYPDGQVVCGPTDGDATFTTAPVVVFEVASPGDERRDRIVKADEYLRIGSIETYVILGQVRVEASVMRRSGQAWSMEIVRDGGTLQLSALGIGVPLAELYDGIQVT